MSNTRAEADLWAPGSTSWVGTLTIIFDSRKTVEEDL